MGERFYGIDALRGLAVVNMIAYHFLYDLNSIYGLQIEWTNAPLIQLWQQSICWGFILIAGFSWEWGRKHNLKRGLKLIIYGLIISTLSIFLLPNHATWFGILIFLGSAILLQILLSPLTNRLSPLSGILLSLIFHFLLRDIQLGLIGTGWEMPHVLYTNYIGSPMGLPPVYFSATDYVPFLPWYPVFLCGTYLYRLFLQRPEYYKPAKIHIPVLSKLGRHALPVYLLHQPILLAICYFMIGWAG